MNVFKYNKDARYAVRPFNPKSIDPDKLQVAVGENNTFTVKISNPLDHYLNPAIKQDHIAKAWFSHPMQFFQNQLNFAVFCATAGCGVSYTDHLNHPDLLVKSVYRFHFYYTLRRILSELQAPSPHDKTFNPFNNRIDQKAFERICYEFDISLHTDFRQKLDLNHGLGTPYYPYTHREYRYEYHPPYTSFASGTTVRLGSIEQKHKNAWTTFVLDTSKGFTRAGIERINDSIRTYIWCLLGSQAQVKSDIMDPSTGFDAQKQYLANLEDAINSVVDLPSSIQRYQNVLKYARSKVDFTVGNGLYMLPSNLRLQIGTIVNYNNKIVIAGDDQTVGKNEDVNTQVIPPIIQPISVVHHPIPEAQNLESSTDDHDNQKTALVVLLLCFGLLGLHFS